MKSKAYEGNKEAIDALKVKSNTASSADVWVSVVDAISE